MSIERYKDMRIPTCDICGDTLPEEYDFSDAVQAMKDAGWKIQRNDDGEWEHFCPECREGEVDNE